jgi:uncharacterized protein YukE
MNYASVDAMEASFGDGSKQLEAAVSELKNIASALEQGALLGDAGKHFVDAINGVLVPIIGRLDSKFAELQKALQTAKQDMQGEDQWSASQF